MMQVIVSEFVTLDGVFEDPGGVEGFSEGGWAFRYDRGPEGDRFKLDEILAAEALILGRKTYEGFADAWPSRTDESGFADKMNAVPKYVASSTLRNPGWSNTTIIPGDLQDWVRRTKDEGEGDLLVVGSGSIVRQLLQHDLVDEMRLMVFPTVLGVGAALLANLDRPVHLKVSATRTLGATALMTLVGGRSETEDRE